MGHCPRLGLECEMVKHTVCIATSETFFNSDGQSDKCDTVTASLWLEKLSIVEQ